MNIPPLCIIQARHHSTRLPGKMLLKLGGETLIARAWRLACSAFEASNVVVAIPAGDQDGPLGAELARVHATTFLWGGDESDLLGRFHVCAHTYRWHPDSVIVRWTPDDPFKVPRFCRYVAESGVRLPVELGAEAFTLAMLDSAMARPNAEREHLTHTLFPAPPPAAPPGIWTVDEQSDYAAAVKRFKHEASA